jgi:hypothetical protein
MRRKSRRAKNSSARKAGLRRPAPLRLARAAAPAHLLGEAAQAREKKMPQDIAAFQPVEETRAATPAAMTAAEE